MLPGIVDGRKADAPRDGTKVPEVRTYSSSEDITHKCPQWRIIPVDQIEIHPAIELPAFWPGDFLTTAGIILMARFTPVHVVECGVKFRCFAGLRLLIAAKSTRIGLSNIEALVYPSISTEQLSEVQEMEADILPVWHREDANQRKETDQRYLSLGSAHGLRLEWAGKEQGKWTTILRTSLRNLQNRLATLRKTA